MVSPGNLDDDRLTAAGPVTGEGATRPGGHPATADRSMIARRCGLQASNWTCTSPPAVDMGRLFDSTVPVTAAMLKYENGGEAANWFSLIACECAPGPQGRPNRPPSTISPGVGRRRRPIDGRFIDRADSYVA
jgi:hypothetical protein